MVSRRGFLGILGGAIAAKPDLPSLVTPESLNIRGVGLLAGISESDSGPIPHGGWEDDKDSLTKRLLSLTAKSLLDHDYDRISYHPWALDVNTASLRSVSLGAKMRISRDKQYQLAHEREIADIKRRLLRLKK